MQVMHNPKYEALYAATQGPSQPFAQTAAQRESSLPSGHVEAEEMEQYAFVQQINSARRARGAELQKQESLLGAAPSEPRQKKKREEDPAVLDSWAGPWAAPDDIRPSGGGLSIAELEELGRQYEEGKKGGESNNNKKESSLSVSSEGALPAQLPAEGRVEKKGKKKKGGAPGALPCAEVRDGGEDYAGRGWVERAVRSAGRAPEKCFAPRKRGTLLGRHQGE